MKKVDFIFNGFLIFWGVFFYGVGYFAMIGYFVNDIPFNNLPITIILVSQLFFSLPTLIVRKKLSDLLYFPLIYMYYAIYSFIIIHEAVDNLLLKKNKKYSKAKHNQSTLKQYVQNTI